MMMMTSDDKNNENNKNNNNNNSITCISFDATGTFLCSSSANGTVRVRHVVVVDDNDDEDDDDDDDDDNDDDGASKDIKVDKRQEEEKSNSRARRRGRRDLSRHAQIFRKLLRYRPEFRQSKEPVRHVWRTSVLGIGFALFC